MTAGAVTIAVETPLQDDIRALVQSLNDHLLPLSPLEFQFKLTAEQMAEPGVTLWVMRNDAGEAVAMGALKEHGDGLAEVKRMFTKPDLRGRGMGRRILAAIEEGARQRGISTLVLETGSTAGFEPAWALYEAAGFSRCGAFLDYPDSGYSRFYEKTLSR
ncbi:GNAT family N-acetyltransferase [Consotaella salsifontis]|uniref:Putative acetyltransferase n=1 Tax=Consotaella salsifontis TaxID=1365950 RepID=A0A1T4LPX2_9HYPH|nr:GNAT family N-acetyltransferase [Consotaella salsifontis]SJZ56687.1 putative acetyltransferase [Consotaella salsifontis]